MNEKDQDPIIDLQLCEFSWLIEELFIEDFDNVSFMMLIESLVASDGIKSAKEKVECTKNWFKYEFI
jgi:hypothetical protein